MTRLQYAQRMARHGHKEWIWWRDNTSEQHAIRLSAESLKTVLIAVGTQGKWAIVSANTGIPTKGFWWLGINLLRQYKNGLI